MTLLTTRVAKDMENTKRLLDLKELVSKGNGTEKTISSEEKSQEFPLDVATIEAFAKYEKLKEDMEDKSNLELSSTASSQEAFSNSIPPRKEEGFSSKIDSDIYSTETLPEIPDVSSNIKGFSTTIDSETLPMIADSEALIQNLEKKPEVAKSPKIYEDSSRSTDEPRSESENPISLTTNGSGDNLNNRVKILEHQEDSPISSTTTEPLLPMNEIRTEVIIRSAEEEEMEYVDTNDNAVAESVVRTIRQLRPNHPPRPRQRAQWTSTPQALVSHNYRSIETNPYQQHPVPHHHLQQQQQQQQYHHQQGQQGAYSFGVFNPYLTPPSTPSYSPLNSINSLNSAYKPNYQIVGQQQPQSYKQKPKVVYTGYNLSLPPPPSLKEPHPENDFRPIIGNYYSSTGSSSTLGTSTTIRPLNYVNDKDLLPYILQSLKELKEQRKKLQALNFSYFHLDNQPLHERTTQTPPSFGDYKSAPVKVTPNSHFSQISTVGGFYNNKNLPSQQTYQTKFPQPPAHNYGTEHGYVPSTTTESNYFQYNIIANQKMKNFYSTLKGQTTSLETSTLAPVTSNINIVSPPKLGKFPGFEQFTTGITYANATSASQPESFQTFMNPVTTTESQHTRPSSSLKPPIKLQFNLPEFISSLQTHDMAHLNPAVVDMLKYVQEVHKERPPISSSSSSSSPAIPSTSQGPMNPTVTPIYITSKRPTKGYESYLNSLKGSSTIGSSTSSTTSTTEYYDEEYEEEEEDESETDVRPPPEMKPYVPMTETMAPPRQQMLLPQSPTENPLKSSVSIYDTGFVLATTTRRPFFGQFYQHPTQIQANQIPSFINFPSDYFQEIKQKLPGIKLQFSSELPQTSNKPTRPSSTTSTTTRTTTTTTSTTTTTTTTPRPIYSTTTMTIPKMRYTIRPNRHRGQNKWNSQKNTTTATNTLTVIDSKDKTVGLRKRPLQLASSSMALNSGVGSNRLNTNLKDLNGPNKYSV
ncbi:uncharacterized protein LOC142226703 [Haematobia irritans]|uniref:uncharacterized protein LOC142226703 n=1 Tax=Haematobia irritans TaxID=7368 RepID=UPI003F4FEB68